MLCDSSIKFNNLCAAENYDGRIMRNCPDVSSEGYKAMVRMGDEGREQYTE